MRVLNESVKKKEVKKTRLLKQADQVCEYLQFVDFGPNQWPWQAVLNFSHVSIKLKKQNENFQPVGNILASPEVGRGNCFVCVWRLPRFSASQEDKETSHIVTDVTKNTSHIYITFNAAV